MARTQFTSERGYSRKSSEKDVRTRYKDVERCAYAIKCGPPFARGGMRTAPWHSNGTNMSDSNGVPFPKRMRNMIALVSLLDKQ